MKTAPTLIDTVYRATFRNEPVLGFKSNAELRDKLVNARRFWLDTPTSSFLGELATLAFKPKKGTVDPDNDSVISWKGNPALARRQVESMRVSARAPHKIMWVEYDLRAAAARTQGLLGREFDPQQTAEREGWLIEQHPQMETAFRLHLFTWNPKLDEADEHGFSVWSFPFIYTWTTDEQQTPWPSIISKFDPKATSDSAIATGILSFDSPAVSIAQSDMQLPVARLNKAIVANLIREWVGIVRRVWALLATIDDLPLTITDVRQSKGFVAKGRYRKFLNHSTVTINIPQKDQTKIARQLIALVRRRAHHVRGHWRDDWRNPPSKRCPALMTNGTHLWTAEQKCSICSGHRMWVHEHERGDASLGFTTHDYQVKHAKESET